MDENSEGWTEVRRQRNTKTIRKKSSAYIKLSNAYATLPQFSAPPTPHDDPPNNEPTTTATPKRDAHASRHRMKAERRRAARRKKADDKRDEETFFDEAITDAEDERTTTAKAANKIKPPARRKVPLLQRGKSVGWALSTSLRQTSNNILARK